MRKRRVQSTVAVMVSGVVATSSIFLTIGEAVGQQQKVTASNEVGSGLNTTTFLTPKGKISVNLPEDLAAGDTLSGTVIAEPMGNTPEELANASDELNGYVVEIKKVQEAPPIDKPAPVATTPTKTKKPVKICADPVKPTFTCALPPIPEPIQIVLTDPKGKKVCDHDVQYPQDPPKSDCPGGSCLIPDVAQAGKPINIKGECNGHASDSKVCVGGQDCQILAEGPRGTTAKGPKNVIGEAPIQVTEGDKTAQSTIRCLAVKLSSPKTVLKKGESSTVTVAVYGLSGYTDPVHLTIRNRSPNVIDLQGGSEQKITIDPAQFN